MEPQMICRLAKGDVASWHGLPSKHFRRADIPDCLGPVVSRDLSTFVLSTYRVERHEPGGGARVDVYSWWGDDRVAILDAWLAPPLNAASLLESLPTAERRYRYEPVDRELWGITVSPDAIVEEAVWGSHGLSVVIVRGTLPETIVRVRGFEAMAPDQWIDGFVRFVAIPEE